MRKLRRNPKRLEEEKKDPVKKKVLYRKRKSTRCEYVNPRTGVRCAKKSFGKGNFCELHSHTKIKEDRNREITPINGNALAVKYDPINHPQLFIQMASEGYSPQEIAAGIGISMDTIKEWCETYVLFDQAYRIGQTAHEAYYISKGRRNLTNKDFQTALYKYLTMNNGLGWSDKVDSRSQVQGQFGVLLVPGEMGVDEWEQNNIRNEKAIEQRMQAEEIIEPDYYEKDEA